MSGLLQQLYDDRSTPCNNCMTLALISKLSNTLIVIS